MKHSSLPGLALGFILGTAGACSPVSPFEQTVDEAVLAFVEVFQVPDSSHITIPVKLKGVIGGSTAYRFDRINYVRKDSLLQIGIWGRHVEKTGEKYEALEVIVDTTLFLQTPLYGFHYVQVFAANGLLEDTTFVY